MCIPLGRAECGFLTVAGVGLAVAGFGRKRRALDRGAARGYPIASVPTRRATEVLRNQPCDLPTPPPLRAAEALTALRDAGAHQGLLVC